MYQSENKYEKIKLLGQGSYGKAYLAILKKDMTYCVIKQMDLKAMTQEQRLETIKQARILEALKHPNIITFRQSYKTKSGKLHIVMDYADGGDMGKKIKQAKGIYFSEHIILNWFTQICLAIKHIHDRKIIHRDLKCQNIFLTKQNIIKLGDFGIARVLAHTKEKIKTKVGTPYYLSPQICQNKDYSFKTDIWSLGVLLYQLCALKPPFDSSSLAGLALKIAKGQFLPLPACFSKQIKKLVSDLLLVQPFRRPSIYEVLKSPIIKKRIEQYYSKTLHEQQFSHTIFHNQHLLVSNLVSPQNPYMNVNFPNNQTPQNKKKISKQFKVINQYLKKDKGKKLQKRQSSDPNLVQPKLAKKIEQPNQLNIKAQNSSNSRKEKNKKNQQKPEKFKQISIDKYLYQIKQELQNIVEEKEPPSQQYVEREMKESLYFVYAKYQGDCDREDFEQQTMEETLQQIINQQGTCCPNNFNQLLKPQNSRGLLQLKNIQLHFLKASLQV